MISLIYSGARRVSSPRWVILLGVLFLISAVLNVGQPYGLAQLSEITGGIGALDEASYSPADAYHTLAQMGAAGRAFYQRVLLTTELAFPLVYRLFNVALIAFLFGRWLQPKSDWNKLCLLPLVGMLADYCENALVLAMLSRYPDPFFGVASMASVASSIKWLSNYVDYTLMAAGLAGLGIHYLSGLLRMRQASA